ncbi:unnamed protein product [Eruca vesicaria subsp. sativa]|uniref:Uncharacterized protein n=1 Tax=Eruca vesicaria subsp. sativa TaxID=29727 RepID=A0ABC8KJ76_ERUVS|nr:unnamed protein product [Eruca vesicaria subsp. sativa]
MSVSLSYMCLRILSLILGIDITDVSVAAITSIYKNLELLDLSGSSITYTGLGMICDFLPDTLSKLLVNFDTNHNVYSFRRHSVCYCSTASS